VKLTPAQAAKLKERYRTAPWQMLASESILLSSGSMPGTPQFEKVLSRIEALVMQAWADHHAELGKEAA
jgi:hypothetical protein